MKYLRIALIISIGAFFASLFFTVTTPITDPDFWWHLATGRWMAEHGSLMHADPFNYLQFPLEDSLRRDFILKEYWLSQLIMFGTYSLGGFKALVCLRALIYSLMFFITWRLARLNGAGGFTATALVMLSALVVVRELGYTGVRPQMASSLLSLVTLLLLEHMRRGRRLAHALLPLTMLLWANLHGGFVFGWAIIGVYVIASIVDGKATKPFLIACAAAIVASLLNPCGFSAVRITIASVLATGDTSYWKSIMESRSLFEHAPAGAVLRGMPWLVTLVALSITSFIPGIRRPSRLHIPLLLLFPFVLYTGYTAVRYIVFFAPVAAIFAGMNLGTFFTRVRDNTPPRYVERLRPYVMALSIAGILLMSAWNVRTGRQTSVFTAQPVYAAETGGAATFIMENKLTGRMFNDYNHGGFLIWWLYPGGVQVFSDGRALSLQGFELYRKVADSPFLREQGPRDLPIYRKVFNDYGVTMVLTSGVDRVSGVMIGLNLALLEDPTWVVVYADQESIVYVKNVAENQEVIRRHRQSDRLAYDNILFMARRAASGAYGHIMPDVWLSMAIGYEGRGEYREALDALQRYSQLRKGNMFAENLRQKIMIKMNK